MRFAALFVVMPLVALAAGPAIAAPADTPTRLPTTELSIGSHKLTVEIAATPSQRSTGLMHRFSLQADHGMLFVFDQAEPQAFWMQNTYIALTIAFLDDQGRIVNLEDMAPQTVVSHWSRGPARYAIEMRKGWFADHGIRAGDQVSGLQKPAVAARPGTP